jgi:hypothetical protein
MQARERLDDLLAARSMRVDWDVSANRVTSEEWRVLGEIFRESLRAGDPNTVQQAVETLRHLRKVGVADGLVRTGKFGPRTSSTRPNDRRSAHEKALAVLFARSAAEDRNVSVVRREVLGERLISVGEVDSWLRARGDLPRDAGGAPSVPVRVLAYGIPGCDTALHMAVAADGPLGLLAELSERLARTYSWAPAEATLFVLTGQVPLVTPIRVELREGREAASPVGYNPRGGSDMHAQRGGR